MPGVVLTLLWSLFNSQVHLGGLVQDSPAPWPVLGGSRHVQRKVELRVDILRSTTIPLSILDQHPETFHDPTEFKPERFLSLRRNRLLEWAFFKGWIITISKRKEALYRTSLWTEGNDDWF